MPAITGDMYKKRVDSLHSEVYVDGSRIEGEISEHSTFRGVIDSQAALYDLQHHPLKQSYMMFDSEVTGNKIGMSYLIPTSKADLAKRRIMIQEWARYSGGLMGRSPDYMNTVLASFAASLDILEGQENCYPDRLAAFYEYAREKDLSFTHTFVNPQNNRSKLSFLEEDVTNARVVRRIEEGLVMKGAKLLATQGGITDELLVFSAPGMQDKSHAYGFSIPSNTKGLKFVCRESFVNDDSLFNSPLSSRFEEMDTIVIFDEVIVPWNRVFFYDNMKAASDLYVKGKFVPFTLHQIVSRQVVKTEFLLSLAQQIVDTISISEYQHVQSKVVEIVKGLETMKALLFYSEHQSQKDHTGAVVPARHPLLVAINHFQDIYPRFTEIIQLLSASGLMTIPTERDFDSKIGESLVHYLQATDKNGKEKVQLFRLAWDLCMSAFGSRQTLYERFFFGDPIRLSQTIYQTYDKDHYYDLVEQFMRYEKK